jgi:hypothetical protein
LELENKVVRKTFIFPTLVLALKEGGGEQEFSLTMFGASKHGESKHELK